MFLFTISQGFTSFSVFYNEKYPMFLQRNISRLEENNVFQLYYFKVQMKNRFPLNYCILLDQIYIIWQDDELPLLVLHQDQ